MVRLIGFALLLIAIVTLVVWGISQFVQPILPAGINGGLVLFVAALAGVVGFFSAFKDSIELLQMVAQARDQRFLNESLGRTVFDKATIEQATRYYIRPKCSNIDPAQEQEMRHALVVTREDLFAKVDYFLDEDQTHRHLLVLADSGTGKTSFVLNYYAYNARRPVRKRHKLAIVPLGVSDADEILKGIPEPTETVVFLDALDEDTKAIKDHRERIRELMALCSKFKRVVITCRTQFFPKDEEIPVETGIARIGPRKAGQKGAYEFVKLYLSPFDDQDVKRYLWRRYPFWARHGRQMSYELALKIPLLSVRPMLLAHIPDIVATGVEIKHSHQLYEAMVDAWLERESSWVDKQALREFSEHLAVNLYLNRVERGMERVSCEQLSALTQTWGIPLDAWQTGGRSLLNRDAEGNYKFAHRSIMEYLFTLRLRHGDEHCRGVALTDQMKIFLLEMVIGSLQAFDEISRFLVTVDWVATPVETGMATATCPTCLELVLFLELLGALSGTESGEPPKTSWLWRTLMARPSDTAPRPPREKKESHISLLIARPTEESGHLASVLSAITSESSLSQEVPEFVALDIYWKPDLASGEITLRYFQEHEDRASSFACPLERFEYFWQMACAVVRSIQIIADEPASQVVVYLANPPRRAELNDIDRIKNWGGVGWISIHPRGIDRGRQRLTVVFAGVDSVRTLHLASDSFRAGLGIAGLRSLFEYVRLEATLDESPQFTLSFSLLYWSEIK